MRLDYHIISYGLSFFLGVHVTRVRVIHRRVLGTVVKNFRNLFCCARNDGFVFFENIVLLRRLGACVGRLLDE